MSTSDQQGNQPLTRKQLREIRLTGATPVITEEDAAAAAATPAAAPLPSPAAAPAPPAEAPRSDGDVDLDATPLTRRQVREHERIRTASVPVIALGDESGEAESAGEEPTETEHEIVSGVPIFAPVGEVFDEEEVDEEEVDEEEVDDEASDDGDVPSDDVSSDDVPVDVVEVVVDDEADDEDPIATGERPVVSPAFGTGLLKDQGEVPAFTPSFDDLITSDSGGSQHLAPNTLIFTPSASEGSLSGPVASTGELLITGSYDLPRGIGSRGHADGTTDGKDADAVLIDGELAPSSSPTPIAASSAISTTKPAGEVIRPPAPEKGNKLMLTLAITAGGLALALAVVLIVAFTTNVV